MKPREVKGGEERWREEKTEAYPCRWELLDLDLGELESMLELGNSRSLRRIPSFSELREEWLKFSL